MSVGRSLPGQAEHCLPQISDGVFLYESPTYPIDVEITVVDTGSEHSVSTIRMHISARPRSP